MPKSTDVITFSGRHLGSMNGKLRGGNNDENGSPISSLRPLAARAHEVWYHFVAVVPICVIIELAFQNAALVPGLPSSELAGEWERSIFDNRKKLNAEDLIAAFRAFQNKGYARANRTSDFIDQLLSARLRLP